MSDIMVTAQSFWIEGMKYAGRAEHAQPTDINRKRFKSLFGTTPGICLHLWTKILDTLPNGAHFFHLLWGLLFLTVYSNERVLSALVGGVDEKTFRKWQWAVVSSISLLKPEVVSFLESMVQSFQVYIYKPYFFHQHYQNRSTLTTVS